MDFDPVNLLNTGAFGALVYYLLNIWIPRAEARWDAREIRSEEREAHRDEAYLATLEKMRVSNERIHEELRVSLERLGERIERRMNGAAHDEEGTTGEGGAACG